MTVARLNMRAMPSATSLEVLMGWGDSQVAKHAADMVLADDNFATIGEVRSVTVCRRVLSRVDSR